MFSVVIPLYNKAHTILRTLTSVLNQTFVDFEVVIINDGSTDNGIHLINNFTSDKRINIYKQENQGVSVARNNGVKMSKFPYVAFLDGDDEWLPDYLFKVKEAIELFTKAGFFGTSSWHRNFLNGVQMEHTPDRYRNKIQEVDYVMNLHEMSHTSAIVVCKAFFNKIDNGCGFPAGMKCCEDWTLFIRLASVSAFVYIGLPLGVRNYKVPGQFVGLSHDARFSLLINVVNYYNTIFDFWEKANVLDNKKVDFICYDLRHRIVSSLRIHDYRTIVYLIDGLDNRIKNKFRIFELDIYISKKLNRIARVIILFTKVVH